MGKRKKSRKQPQKKPLISKLKVPKEFDCPFCRREKTVRVDTKMTDDHVMYLKCTACEHGFKDLRSKLDAPIDVYMRMIEECKKKRTGIYSSSSKSGEETAEVPTMKGAPYLDCPLDDAYEDNDTKDKEESDAGDELRDEIGVDDEDESDQEPSKKKSRK